MSAIEANGQSTALDTSANLQQGRDAADVARAALWTGIIGTARHLGKRDAQPVAPRPSVVQLRQGSARTQVYFIGAGLFEYHLAQLIPSDHSIFAVEISWPAEWHDAAINNDVQASPMLEQMVGPYVDALLAHAGGAPCVLVGYSFHGSMAFEAAHQIRERGGHVESVLLLDAPAEYPVWHRATLQNLRKVWSRATALSLASRIKLSIAIADWFLVEFGKMAKRRLQQLTMQVPGKLTTKLDTLGRPMQWHMIERLYAHSLRCYRLRRLDVHGVIFRTDRADDCPSPTVDPSLGWSAFFGNGLDIVEVTGDHETMMRQRPHDMRLARAISRILNGTVVKTADGAPRTQEASPAL